MCFLPNSRYHIVLIGNFKELLQKLDAFCFNYQHVDCLYTIFKYRLSGKSVVKSGKLFDNLQRALHFSLQIEEWTECPESRKRDSSGKSTKKHLLSSFQKTKSTQTSGSIFADRIEQVKKTNIEFELPKIADCFLDGDGNYTSKLVSFKKNFVN